MPRSRILSAAARVPLVGSSSAASSSSSTPQFLTRHRHQHFRCRFSSAVAEDSSGTSGSSSSNGSTPSSTCSTAEQLKNCILINQMPYRIPYADCTVSAVFETHKVPLNLDCRKGQCQSCEVETEVLERRTLCARRSAAGSCLATTCHRCHRKVNTDAATCRHCHYLSSVNIGCRKVNTGHRRIK